MLRDEKRAAEIKTWMIRGGYAGVCTSKDGAGSAIPKTGRSLSGNRVNPRNTGEDDRIST
jgi:hypothetical protein